MLIACAFSPRECRSEKNIASTAIQTQQSWLIVARQWPQNAEWFCLYRSYCRGKHPSLEGNNINHTSSMQHAFNGFDGILLTKMCSAAGDVWPHLSSQIKRPWLEWRFISALSRLDIQWLGTAPVTKEIPSGFIYSQRNSNRYFWKCCLAPHARL